MTSIQRVLGYTILASCFALTACGGSPGTVYPEGGNKGTDTGNGNGKSTVNEPRFSSGSLAANVSVAVFNLHRAIDLGLHGENAESLEKRSNCQVIASGTGSNVVQIETEPSACRSAASGNQWRGSEVIEMTSGSDGLFQTLKTENGSYSFSTKNTKRDINQETHTTITLTRANSSRPGNAITYNFDETFVVETEISQDGKPINQDSTDSTVKKTSSDRSYNGTHTAVVSGQIEIDKTTKLMTSITFSKATVELAGILESGVNFTDFASTLTLSPTSAEFTPVTCGRFDAELSLDQTLTSKNGGRSTDGERISKVNFTSKDVISTGTRKVTLGSCKPGFATLTADLDTITSQILLDLK